MYSTLVSYSSFVELDSLVSEYYSDSIVKETIYHICSFGVNCHIASIIKELGWKKASYPFDWIFSDLNMVLDCLQDRFKKFLDRSYMEQIEEILDLVKKKMVEQAAYDRDAYKELVEETIDYFIEKGKLTDDDNLEFIEDSLMEMWEEVSEEMSDND